MCIVSLHLGYLKDVSAIIIQGTPYCAPNLKLQRRSFEVVTDQIPFMTTQFISTFISRRKKYH